MMNGESGFCQLYVLRKLTEFRWLRQIKFLYTEYQQWVALNVCENDQQAWTTIQSRRKLHHTQHCACDSYAMVMTLTRLYCERQHDKSSEFNRIKAELPSRFKGVLSEPYLILSSAKQVSPDLENVMNACWSTSLWHKYFTLSLAAETLLVGFPICFRMNGREYVEWSQPCDIST